MTGQHGRHVRSRLVLNDRGDDVQHFDPHREPRLVAHRRLTREDLRDGAERPVPLNSTPAVIEGLGVVLAGDDGCVTLYRYGLAAEVWTRRLPAGVYASPVADPARRQFIVAATNGLVAAIGASGKVNWTRKLDHPVYAMPTVWAETGTVVCACFRSTVAYLNASTGDVDRLVEVPKPWDAAVDGIIAGREIYATPVLVDDLLIVVAGESVVALDDQGRLRWQVEVGSAVKASPVVLPDSGTVLIAATDGLVRAVEAKTGQVHGSVALGGRINGTPYVCGDTVVCGTRMGSVFGLAADAGGIEVRWEVPGVYAPFSYTSFTGAGADVVIGVRDQQDIIALRASDGSFLWQTSQVMGKPEHDGEVHTTPVVTSDGHMFATSYDGDLYEYLFRPASGGGDGDEA
ncbi:PQQ-binding-like beta-propeller repeat protein [Kribbella koreensis]|uniref:PQQ-binding-like beta-propeller repeat protein n=1 Tax=Kribbella koreensis TaxID=57909 RepID=UPI0031DCD13B